MVLKSVTNTTISTLGLRALGVVITTNVVRFGVFFYLCSKCFLHSVELSQLSYNRRTSIIIINRCYLVQFLPFGACRTTFFQSSHRVFSPLYVFSSSLEQQSFQLTFWIFQFWLRSSRNSVFHSRNAQTEMGKCVCYELNDVTSPWWVYDVSDAYIANVNMHVALISTFIKTLFETNEQ